MKSNILIALLAVSVVTARAQTIDTNHPPNTGDVLTNAAKVYGGSAVLGFALNLLPYWDKTATNSFNGNELILGTGPAFKSATVSGSTPYLSLYGEYMPARNFGGGVSVITLGNGAGSQDVDSAHAYLIGRKDIGNVAGFIHLGGGRNISWSKYDFEAGGGLEFMYSTGVALRVGTDYLYYPDKLGNFSNHGTSKVDHEFLTGVTLNIRF